MVASSHLSISQSLLQYQLFQGLSPMELMEIAGNTKFGFHKYPARKIVVREADPCRELHFLVRGSLLLTTFSDDHGYRLEEELKAPYMFQVETLFGLSQRYVSTVQALTDCQFITLSKDEVMRLLDNHLIIRLNLMGLLSSYGQRLSRRVWRRAPQSLTERLTRFFLDRCTYPAGPKTFFILMQRLADEVGDSRLDVSRALNALQAQGLLALSRGCIRIPYLEHLFSTGT